MTSIVLPPTRCSLTCEAALSYAARGWHVLRTDGKIAIDEEWQFKATTESAQIIKWFSPEVVYNVGVQLGPRSGIIDIEYDSAEGEATVERLIADHFPGGVKTPTFRSLRSTHRLFQYRDDLPQQATVTIDGAEFRIGGGKAAQSVFPPAANREWLPGLSPDEVEVAGLPDSLVEFMLGHRKAKQSSDGKCYAPAATTPNDARSTALAALAVISPNSGYAEWLDVLMALHSVDQSDAMMREAIRWSRGSEKFREGEVEVKWGSFTADGGVTLRTLCYIADATGEKWRPATAVVDDKSGDPETHRSPAATVPTQSEVSERPNEGVDDPHRLAREFVTAECTNLSGERTIVFWRDEFHEHNGIHYHSIPTIEIRARLTSFIKNRFDDENIFLLQHPKMWSGKTPPKCRKVTIAVVSNTLAALQGIVLIDGHRQAPMWLDGTHDIDAADVMPTRSGLLVLPRITTGDYLLQPTAALFSANGVEYEFDRHAECPTWLSFLDSVWPNDVESIQTLQDWMGYLLLSDTRLHKILMLIGPPRSGKGTIGRVMKNLIGENNLACPKLASLSGQFGLQPLLGKTAALISDARLSGRADAIAIVENLLSISGADPQDVHRKNMPTLTGVRLPVRFTVMSNELPNMRDASGALTSRVVLLRMKHSFLGREDHGLDDRLSAELPGILNWAIVGWSAVRDRGTLIQPASGRELLDDLEDLASPVNHFIRERCIIGPEFSVRTADAFEAWKAWCQHHGREHVGTQESFGKDLRAALPQIERKQARDGDSRIRIYQGVGLKADEIVTGWHR